MISLRPFASDVCFCPRCNLPFEAGAYIISGMRNLLDASCKHCGADYYVDLPVGHGLFAPAALDKKTGELFDPARAPWFSSILARTARNRVTDPITITFRRHRTNPDIVLLNCLDYLYGHSLLKLLNVQYYLDHVRNLSCCVLIPKQLSHLVPREVAEIWEVDLPIKRLDEWYIDIEQQVHAEIEKRNICFLSTTHSHPHFSYYDINRFVSYDLLEIKNERNPVIVYCYREDRLWGLSVGRQLRKINDLYKLLHAAFPDLMFAVAGFGVMGHLAEGIIDQRVNAFSLDQEREWLRLYSSADCVVGVHGSNMLLPSGLARNVVELLPEDRFGNITQDLLWPSSPVSGSDALFRVRFLTGSDDLEDIAPRMVATQVVEQVAGGPRYRQIVESSLRFDPGSVVLSSPRDLATSVSNLHANYAQVVRRFRAFLLQPVLRRLVIRLRLVVRVLVRRSDPTVRRLHRILHGSPGR